MTLEELKQLRIAGRRERGRRRVERFNSSDRREEARRVVPVESNVNSITRNVKWVNQDND